MSDRSPEPSLHDFERHLTGMGLVPETVKGYHYRLGRFLRFAGGRNIDQRLIEEFRDEVAPTIDHNTWRAYAHAINTYAAYLGEDCWLGVPKPIRKEAESLRQEEFERLLMAASDQCDPFLASRDRAILLLLGDGAARAGEIRKIIHEDVDLEKGSLVVRRPKGKHDRKVYFGSATKEAIRAYLPNRDRAVGRPDEPFLFLNSWGGPIRGVNTVLEIVRRTAARAGLERRPHPHMVRHMRITQLSHGLNPFQLQRFAGHADISTTMTYVHVDEEEISEAIRNRDDRRGTSLASPSSKVDARQALAIRLSLGEIDGETYNRALKDLVD